ncbi:hypothetical protein J437_LFUL013911 [Ladona fulva]|nr:hypothetical protein J437_LFUL013911 [Ladona fulva]
MRMSQFEQRSIVRFCVLLGKMFVQTFELIKQAYGDAALGQTAVYNWQSLKDNQRSGWPSTACNDEIIAQVRDIILADSRQTVADVAGLANISIGSCHAILHDD